MTFIFAGQKIPIHPLDTSLDLNVTNTAGERVCLGAVSACGIPTGTITAHLLLSSNLSALHKMTITTSSSEWRSVRVPDNPRSPACSQICTQFETLIPS